jgi:hypothetical protein
VPSLSFEGETHDEIVRKVRRWLASVEGVHEDSHITLPVAVERATELTKDALTIVAQAAPGPIARSEIFRGLTRMGYDATENTKRAVINGLDTLADTEEGVLKRASDARRSVVYEMNSAVAKQLLRAIRG